jgi:hypothetical protein
MELIGYQTFQTKFDKDNISSRDVFDIYKKVYDFAKKLGDPVWTEASYKNLHLRFTNPGMSPICNYKRRALCSLSLEVDNYYETLFRELQYFQEQANDLD